MEKKGSNESTDFGAAPYLQHTKNNIYDKALFLINNLPKYLLEMNSAV